MFDQTENQTEKITPFLGNFEDELAISRHHSLMHWRRLFSLPSSCDDDGKIVRWFEPWGRLKPLMETNTPFWTWTPAQVISALRKAKGLSSGGTCPYCGGLKTVNDKRRGMLYCICYMFEWQELLRELLHDYRVPLRKDNVFEKFNTVGRTPSETNALQGIFDSVYQWAQWPNKWVWLSGGVGTGKTHLGQAAAWLLGPTSLYIDGPTLHQIFYGSVKDRNIEEVRERLRIADALIIDDWRAEHETNWGEDSFFDLLNWRYNRSDGYPVFVITNVSPDEIQHDSSDRAGNRLLDKEISIRLRFPAFIKSYRTNGGGNG